MNTITFKGSLKEEMLRIFGVSINGDGFLVKGNDLVLTDRNEPVKLDEFAGFRRGNNGKIVAIKNDICSLIELSDIMEDK